MTERDASEESAVFHHLPVMPDQVLQLLAPKPGSLIVDATLGGGGHASFILKANAPDGILIGIDRDADAIAAAKEKLQWAGSRARLIKGVMSDVAQILSGIGIESVDGIMADLGVSSFQFDFGARGFSFKADAPLDMRMDASLGETAADLLERLGEHEIAGILWEFGEERYSRRIARAIKQAPPIRTTAELAELVSRAVPPFARHGRIHPATRSFQALRIAVNDELGELARFLAEAPGLLNPGGRLVIISYHSLEDRLVKRTFRDLAASSEYELPQRKPFKPDESEVEKNPRSRSAVMRVLERVGR